MSCINLMGEENMRTKVLGLVEVLGVAVLLFGCGSQEKQETKKDSSQKTEKKVSSSQSKKKSSSTKTSSSSKMAASSSQTKEKDANESGIDDSGFKRVSFPANMQGTWYGWDKYNKQIQTVTFSGNKWVISGEYGHTSYAYDGSVRTAEDQAVFENPGNPGKGLDEAKENKWVAWKEFSIDKDPISQDGSPVEITNLRGWYQGSGDGTYYYITSVDINGQPTPVLTQASGAGIWVDMHYYRSEDLAAKQKDTHIDTDVIQGEDYDTSDDESDEVDNDEDTNDEDYDDEENDDENYDDNEEYNEEDEETDEY